MPFGALWLFGELFLPRNAIASLDTPLAKGAFVVTTIAAIAFAVAGFRLGVRFRRQLLKVALYGVALSAVGAVIVWIFV